MARKSAASLSIVKVMPGQRDAPPRGMPKLQAAVWRAVIATKPAGWFTADSHPLLAQYCRHVVTADELQIEIDAIPRPLTPEGRGERSALLKERDRETRAVMTLARSMRLTQQSRLKAETAATAHARGGNGELKPWQVSG